PGPYSPSVHSSWSVRIAERGPSDGQAWMKLTTSLTVLRFLSWSSGISTLNSSCAATAISTIDRESMSRSSTKLFSGVTSEAGIPVISLMILPRPSRISCSVMAMSRLLLGFVPYGSSPVVPVSRRTARRGGPPYTSSGDLDHLPGVGEARAEAEQQRQPSGGRFAAFDHA